MLRHRVRYFTDGAVIGSSEFVNEAFANARDRFSEKRKDGARKLRGNGKAAAGQTEDLPHRRFEDLCGRSSASYFGSLEKIIKTKNFHFFLSIRGRLKPKAEMSCKQISVKFYRESFVKTGIILLTVNQNRGAKLEAYSKCGFASLFDEIPRRMVVGEGGNAG